MQHLSWMRGALGAVLAAILFLGGAAQAQTENREWLVVLTPGNSDMLDPAAITAEQASVVNEHFDYWLRLTRGGRVIIGGRSQDVDELGRLPPDTVGLFIFLAPDRASAQRIIDADPAIKSGLMRPRLYSYRIAVQR